MELFVSQHFDDHERVVYGSDPRTGLRAIIAIHSTVLGPAVGGCRMWPYVSTEEATTDVLRLSRGMSYKNALAGLPSGGGKAVIIGDPRHAKTPELFEAYGRFVESLAGRYITAEDVGTSIADMEQVARATSYVTGLRRELGSAGGDPSPKTALGVLLGIQQAAHFKWSASDLRGRSVAIQGLGGVGYNLCRLLAAEGAQLRVADTRAELVERACEEFNARAVPVESILTDDADILAPCALGAVLNSRSIPQIRAAIVAGAANNQLASLGDGESLERRGILYAPDYVINAGGIISAVREYAGGATEAGVDSEIRRIPERLREIFERSRHEKLPTNIVADDMARAILRRHDNRLVA